LKRVARTRAAVGRIARPLADLMTRPLALPPMILNGDLPGALQEGPPRP
jgi:hypothetical protein